MLIWMRNSAFAGAFKYILLGLLVLAVVGLVLLDIGGFFQGTGSANHVAKGGGVTIGTQEFDRTLRRVLASQGIPPQEAYKLGIVDGVLASEIQNRLFTEKAHDLGLIADDEAVKRQIATLAESVAADGRSRKEALQQILRTQGISEKEFISSLRNEMGNGLLRAALSPPATLASPLMAKTLYRFDNETRSADIVLLKNADAKTGPAPTDEQLQKFYTANKAAYLVPGSRTVTIATLKPDMLRKNVTVDETAIRAEYDKNKAAFTKAPRRAVEQMVAATEDEAEKIAADMKAGNTPKAALKQEHEKDRFAPEIAGPVFDAQKGDVVGPIKTELGWHVLRVVNVVPETVTPFDDVKTAIRTELENAALSDKMYEAGTAIEDRIAGGDKLEDLVTEYGLTTEIVGPFRANGYNADGKDLFKEYGADRDALISAAGETDAGEIAPLVETADGQFRLVRVDQIVPDSHKDFATIRADVQKRWTDEQKQATAKARAEQMLKAVNDGKPIADLAKADGASVQSLKDIKRNAAPAAPLTPASLARLFTTDSGKGFSVETDGGFIIGVVTGSSLPSAPDGTDKSLEALTDLSGRSLSNDILGLFTASLSDGREVKINKPLLDRLYGGEQQPAQ